MWKVVRPLPASARFQVSNIVGPHYFATMGIPIEIGRSVARLLFGIAPTDPASFGFALVAVSTVTLAATCGPARRAASVDPAVALRSE